MNEMGKSDGLCKFDMYILSFIQICYVYLYNFYDYMYLYMLDAPWSIVPGKNLLLLLLLYMCISLTRGYYQYYQLSISRITGIGAYISILNEGTYHILGFYLILLLLTHPLRAPEDS